MFSSNTDEQVCLFQEFNLKVTINHSGTLPAGRYWAHIKDEDNHGSLKYNFDTRSYNPSQKKSFSVCVGSLCHYFYLFHESLCFVVSLCIGVYIYFGYICIIHDSDLNICYVHLNLYDRTDRFDLPVQISVRLSVKAS